MENTLARSGPAAATRRCPACGCAAVRRSRRRPGNDAVETDPNLRPYKCRDCGERFFGPPRRRSEITVTSSRRGRRSRGPKPGARYRRRVLVLGVLLVLAAAVVGYYGLKTVSNIQMDQGEQWGGG